ncbi:hypothetical protein GTCCBUS3UF5_32750 [Geobacillus thermoleovorans CCB_US3_UF5]|uniref:Uncharacterized protein n=1 Tax=Geobacillus thermoleovorans CCB_US3_UF5 TaxID=1111068 RepID=A0ABM5MLU4_GEOTH|nr:hypothetical protein GTCCBUS3UF5_32750 [Geobacillus thermoleovorans CCB_US3_UF5]
MCFFLIREPWIRARRLFFAPSSLSAVLRDWERTQANQENRKSASSGRFRRRAGAIID